MKRCPYYITLLAARNIILGYNKDEEIDFSLLKNVIKNLSEERDRLHSFPEYTKLSNEKSVLEEAFPPQYTVEEKIKHAANLPDVYWRIQKESWFTSETRGWYLEIVDLISDTISSKDQFLEWCFDNAIYYCDTIKRNYFDLKAYSTSPTKEVVFTDCDGVFIAIGLGKLEISLLPNLYKVVFGKTGNPITVKLYKESIINERDYNRRSIGDN